VKEVQKQMCNECLFSNNKIVSDARKKQIIQDCKDNNNYFICHKSSIAGGKAECHGFYKNKANPIVTKMLEDTGCIEFVDVK
jgi:hypothetical protein